MDNRYLSRRTFLTRVGKGAVAVAIFGPVAAACSDNADSTTTAGAGSSPALTSSSAAPTTTLAADTTATTQGPTTTTAAPPTQWERVVLGNVSAYVVARGGRVAIVDTGRSGNQAEIESVLMSLGLHWDSVDHVVLTHLHGDHIGSLGPVMDAASGAAAHAGEADIAAMGASPRPVAVVGDGNSVFGLDIIETPGHTAGHICVHDPEGSVLVAGDALNGVDGGVSGANPSFTPDMASANESVKKLAALSFDTAFFGHGEPVVGGADVQVANLAASL